MKRYTKRYVKCSTSSFDAIKEEIVSMCFEMATWAEITDYLDELENAGEINVSERERLEDFADDMSHEAEGTAERIEDYYDNINSATDTRSRKRSEVTTMKRYIRSTQDFD